MHTHSGIQCLNSAPSCLHSSSFCPPAFISSILHPDIPVMGQPPFMPESWHTLGCTITTTTITTIITIITSSSSSSSSSSSWPYGLRKGWGGGEGGGAGEERSMDHFKDGFDFSEIYLDVEIFVFKFCCPKCPEIRSSNWKVSVLFLQCSCKGQCSLENKNVWC